MKPISQLSQMLRFAIAGVLGVSLYYLILYTLTDIIKIWYMYSAIIASVVNYVSNFLLQKFWTFKNKDIKNIKKQAAGYALMVVILFATNLFLLYLLVEYCHFWYIFAQIIVTIIVTIMSYFISQWIFKK